MGGWLLPFDAAALKPLALATLQLQAASPVIAAGVVAALHVGKLPPALPVLQQALGISLLQAGFLLSLVQLAGMTLGLLTGLAVQRAGLRRSLVAGLLLLALASALGGAAQSAGYLLFTRALEGLGFLWVVLPAPALIRALVPPARLSRMLGVWGAYMPLGAALALLAGPWVMSLASPAWGWRYWWWGLSVLTAGLALLVVWRVPADQAGTSRAAAPSAPGWPALLGLTLRSRAAWWMALSFAMYSGQWLAVVGFLPSIYAQAGVAAGVTAWLTALAAAVNIVGNVGAGRLLQRGVAPVGLLATGFVVMGLGAVLAFGVRTDPRLQYAAVLAFSMVGGLIPGTLFSLALRLAPSAATASTTVGWMQQWSALGQFAGPPLVAWVAAWAGGWQLTAWVTGLCSAAGLLLAWQLHRLLQAPPGKP